MAKTANNKKGDAGKSKSSGKPAQGKKSVAKRADSRPARGKAWYGTSVASILTRVA